MTPPPCNCPCCSAGLTIVGRQHEICQGQSGLPRAKVDQYIARWTGQPAPERPAPAPQTFDCVHRGPVRETRLCDLCGIKGQPFEVLGCALHGECSIGRKHSKVRSCVGCADREPSENPG